MADDYLSDREQEEALRNWWRENWSWIVGGIAAGFIVIAGYFYWQTRTAEQAELAAALYSQVQAAYEADDAERAEQALGDLVAEYRSSAYVQQGRLLVAGMYVRADRTEEALGLLESVADASKDAELAQIARMRAARLMVELGRHDDALKLLQPDRAGGFGAQVREIRGDALYAKGDLEAARAEYAAALAGSDAAIDRSMLEMKLQDVGGETDGE